MSEKGTFSRLINREDSVGGRRLRTFKKAKKTFSKPIDKRENVWYNTPVNEVKPPGFHPAILE